MPKAKDIAKDERPRTSVTIPTEMLVRLRKEAGRRMAQTGERVTLTALAAEALDAAYPAK